MSIKKDQTYKFGDFEFDSDRLSLYHKGVYIDVEPNPLRVLSLLVEKANTVVLHDELIDRAWGESNFGVLPTNVAQSVKKLREALASAEPAHDFIRTARGRGYYFHGAVEIIAQAVEDIAPSPISERNEHETVAIRSSFHTFSTYILGGVGICLIGILIFFITSMPESDDEKIRELLVESQNFEARNLYTDPAGADLSILEKYWVSENIYGLDADIRKVKAGLDKLNRERRKYGTESRAEKFDIQSVEINADGTFATARSLEKWLLAIYSWDGVLLENRTVGPYFVYYTLMKIDGKWKIGKSSTGRTAKTPPVLQSIELVSGSSDNSALSVNIYGANFDIGSLVLVLKGPNCPIDNPCVVDNASIRSKSDVSNTHIRNLPIGLRSGDYDVLIRNGDSEPSNSLLLRIP